MRLFLWTNLAFAAFLNRFRISINEKNYRLTRSIISWYNTCMKKVTIILVALAIIAIWMTAPQICILASKA